MRHSFVFCLALALIGLGSTSAFGQDEARGIKKQPATSEPTTQPDSLAAILAKEALSPTGHRYALCIGIDTYNPDSGYPVLHCAVADAKSLGEIFAALGYRTTVMTDDGYGINNTGMFNRSLVPTAANINRQLQAFARSANNPDDELVISYAGHGDVFDKEAAIVPIDYSRTAGNLVTVSMILGPLNDAQCRARSKLLLLDACHSGAGSSAFFREFTREKSLMVFSACSEKQSSMEDVAIGHGRFTEALMWGLVGKKFIPPATQPAGDDAIAEWNGEAYPGDSEFLSATDLSDYVGRIFKDKGWASKVVSAQGGAADNGMGQNPQLFGEQDVTVRMIVGRRKVSTPPPLTEEDKKTIEETLEKANAAYARRDWVKMIHHATTVLRIQDGNPDALALRAMGNLHSTFTAQANEDAQAALAADPDQAMAQQVCGMCAAEAKDKPSARRYLKAAARLVNANKAKWRMLASGEEATNRTLGMAIAADNGTDAVVFLAQAAASPDLSPDTKGNIDLALGQKYQAGNDVPKDDSKALEHYLQGSSEGNSTATLAAAELYDKGGNGVAQDYGKAKSMYTAAANAGQEKAMYNLASLYEQGHGLSADYAQALAWYKKAAEVGDAAAMNRVGYLCENGLGITQSYALAMSWYLKAAESDYRDAMNNIGALYFHGLGVPPDGAQAKKWYDRAAQLGSPEAMCGIGYLYEHGNGVAQDYAKAMDWYQKAAAAGNISAMNNIGSLYDHHGQGPEDYAKAMDWYRKAADRGYAEAMGNIGYLYDNGRGVTKDYSQALDWYTRAAKAGNPEAMDNLGSLYSTGHGVDKEYGKALFWYHKAADAGNAEAMHNIGNAYLLGNGVPKDSTQAMTWYVKAAKSGFSHSMYQIAGLYENGQGVPKDMNLAHTWYLKAADAGDEDAKKWVAEHGGK